jgi:hypothetical protein
MAENCQTNLPQTPVDNQPKISMEDYLKRQQQIEDQIDYQFIQRIIQE